jgi:hypothetical protein
VNNAYGVQARAITKMVTKAFRVGRVDAVIQSTDKNFMVRKRPTQCKRLSTRPSMHRRATASITGAYTPMRLQELLSATDPRDLAFLDGAWCTAPTPSAALRISHHAPGKPTADLRPRSVPFGHHLRR